jgi:hypothetical protein
MIKSAMTRTSIKLALAALGALSVAGCADGSTGLLSTASVGSSTTAGAGKADPACVALNARINTLRQEGVAERVEKASEGKAKSVSIKRESLVKMTELDKANAEFQSKCALPLPASAAVTPPAAPGAPVASASTAKPVAKTTATAAATTAKPQ